MPLLKQVPEASLEGELEAHVKENKDRGKSRRHFSKRVSCQEYVCPTWKKLPQKGFLV